MKFLTNILILGALAAPILASALPQPQDGDFDSLLSPNPEYDDGVEVFGKKVRKLPDRFCIPSRYLFYISPSANGIASAEVQGRVQREWLPLHPPRSRLRLPQVRDRP